MYQPTGTPGTPIRAPKQQYLPPEQAHLLGPLSKRVKTSNCLSKLQNEPLFFLSPSHHWQGAMYWPTGTLGTPIRNQKQQYYPWNKPIFLSCFLRGQRPGILSQNCQMNHFFYNPPHSWQEAIYWPAKTPGTWQFWEKIAGVYSLFTFSGAKENRLVLEVDIIVLGLWWESPGSQLDPLAKQLKKTGLFWW